MGGAEESRLQAKYETRGKTRRINRKRREQRPERNEFSSPTSFSSCLPSECSCKGEKAQKRRCRRSPGHRGTLYANEAGPRRRTLLSSSTVRSSLRRPAVTGRTDGTRPRSRRSSHRIPSCRCNRLGVPALQPSSSFEHRVTPTLYFLFTHSRLRRIFGTAERKVPEHIALSSLVSFFSLFLVQPAALLFVFLRRESESLFGRVNASAICEPICVPTPGLRAFLFFFFFCPAETCTPRSVLASSDSTYAVHGSVPRHSYKQDVNKRFLAL